jgi:hypothetical protein
LEEIRAATGSDRLEYYNADLSVLSEVHHLAQQIQVRGRGATLCVRRVPLSHRSASVELPLSHSRSPPRR